MPAGFSGRNTVIYGHRMKNGTMFAALGNYQEQVYYDAHPVFLLVTPEGRYVVELFSGYVADTAESAWMLDFSDEQAYLAWLEEVGEKSAFSSKVSPRAEDRVVTLSTCSYELRMHASSSTVSCGLKRSENPLLKKIEKSKNKC